MTINKLNIRESISTATKLLEKEKQISPALRAIMKVLLTLVQIMAEQRGLNSKNSSKPPSTDPNRKKAKQKTSTKKPGGQPGRIGKQLKPISDPDCIEVLKLDKRKLPKGHYTDGGFEARQVVDYEVSVVVTEYRAQVLFDNDGKRFVAKFPKHVNLPIQYGQNTKSNAVYMSQFQLIPYKRIEDYFIEQIGLSISSGSLFNFNKEAYELLEKFDGIAKQRLIDSLVVNSDETGININGKRLWLHAATNDKWTYLFPHHKRGVEAMNEIGIIPKFTGVLCHDHWKPYYQFKQCSHSLCNAHHLRELEWCSIEDNQQWAGNMKKFLEQLNSKVDDAGGKLTLKQSKHYRKKYRSILGHGDNECPKQERKPGQVGRVKQSKSRNLLVRLRDYENDVLRFMDDVNVPFTNNQGENDLRMTKVQQKISGCFRSMEGAYIFCRVRSYLITCRKHGIGANEALKTLFSGKLPDFLDSG